MATMDIFEGDAFTIVELTRALENIPYKPALLSGSNLFSPRGVRSRTVVIESRDGTLSLIPFSERGSAYEQQVPDRREMRAARYANGRVNRLVNAEDTELVSRVQAGMASERFTVGPLSESEVCLRSFASKLRNLIPEARLHHPPAPGWSRRHLQGA